MNIEDKKRPQTIQESLEKSEFNKDTSIVIDSTIHPIGATEASAVGEAGLMRGKGKKWVRITAWIVWGVPSVTMIASGLYLILMGIREVGFSLSTLLLIVVVGFLFIFLPGIYIYILISKKKQHAPALYIDGDFLYMNGVTKTKPIKLADIDAASLDFDKSVREYVLLISFCDGSSYKYLFNGYNMEVVDVVNKLQKK